MFNKKTANNNDYYNPAPNEQATWYYNTFSCAECGGRFANGTESVVIVEDKGTGSVSESRNSVTKLLYCIHCVKPYDKVVKTLRLNGPSKTPTISSAAMFGNWVPEEKYYAWFEVTKTGKQK